MKFKAHFLVLILVIVQHYGAEILKLSERGVWAALKNPVRVLHTFLVKHN